MRDVYASRRGVGVAASVEQSGARLDAARPASARLGRSRLGSVLGRRLACRPGSVGGRGVRAVQLDAVQTLAGVAGRQLSAALGRAQGG